MKKGVLENCPKFTGKQLWFAKFSGAPFLQNTSGRFHIWATSFMHYYKNLGNANSFPNSFQNGDLKRETESLIVAVQNQSIRINLVKAKIDKSQGDSLCRVCRKVDKSIDHIVSGCSKLAQKKAFVTREGMITWGK